MRFFSRGEGKCRAKKEDSENDNEKTNSHELELAATPVGEFCLGQ